MKWYIEQTVKQKQTTYVEDKISAAGILVEEHCSPDLEQVVL